jgi:hypothetical protein
MSARGLGLLFFTTVFVVREAGCVQRQNLKNVIPNHVGAVTALYEMSKSKLGHAPSDEKEFKKAMQTVSVKPKNFKVDSFDELFISERDGQPLTVVYGPAAANSNFIVSEQTGVSGKRMVGLRTGIVEEVDDVQYKQLTASAH